MNHFEGVIVLIDGKRIFVLRIAIKMLRPSADKQFGMRPVFELLRIIGSDPFAQLIVAVQNK